MSFLDLKTEIAIGLLLFVLYVSYYLVVEVKVARVACGDPRLRALVCSLPRVRAAYWPPPWCLHAHAHTVLASVLRSRLVAGPAGGWTRQPVPLRDGGEGSLWWAGGPEGRGETPARGALLVVPGLCGDQRADYVRVLLPAAAALRLRLVVYTHRGLAGQPLKNARLYSAVSDDDVSAALEMAAAAVRGTGEGLLVAVGVSLGGVLLARHLAAAGATTPVRAAMLISAPLDVEKSARCVRRGWLNALLSWHMARSLRRTLAALSPPLCPSPAALCARSLHQFDAAFTAPHFGFASPEEYYAAACPRLLLSRIAVPTLALNAADDPYQPDAVLPWREVASCGRVALVVLSRGGHIGFLSARRPLADHLLADLAHQYFHAVLADTQLYADKRLRPDHQLHDDTQLHADTQLHDDTQLHADTQLHDDTQLQDDTPRAQTD